MSDHKIAIGADVGGSHISCAAVDITNGLLLEETLAREQVDNEGPAENIFAAWAKALNASIAQIKDGQLSGFGFAMPGPFDYRNGISRMKHKFVGIYGEDIAARLLPPLSAPAGLPVRFLNDATSFAVGEAWLGKGRGKQKVLAITLGTGFGSAFIDEGVPVVEREDVPKEGCLWHLPYRGGIADEYFSTRWFVGEYEEKTGRIASGAKEVADKASTDPVAQHLMEEYGANMAEFLAPYLKKFEADIIVMGGNISGAYDLFGPVLREGLALEGIEIPIELSELGEQAAIIGSARLIDEAFWGKVSRQLPSI